MCQVSLRSVSRQPASSAQRTVCSLMAALPENLALPGEKGCDDEDHPRSERWCEVDALFDQVSISLSAFM